MAIHFVDPLNPVNQVIKILTNHDSELILPLKMLVLLYLGLVPIKLCVDGTQEKFATLK